MRHPNRRCVAGLAVLLAIGQLRLHAQTPPDIRSAASASTPASWTRTGECRSRSSRHFEFHSDPWINLHHFLFEWARNVPERLASDGRRPVDVAERDELAALADADRAAWTAALRVYRERVVTSDLLRDPYLIALRTTLATIECPAGPAAPDAAWTDVRATLETAMPVYRRHWWPRHDAANVAAIDAMAPRLDAVEATLASRLAAAYGGHWPSGHVRVDLSAYASWTGAYTTNDPDQVTISSGNPLHAGWTGVEVLFHEVSHASFLEQPLYRGLAVAFGSGPRAIPDGLGHVLQFVTPAELLRPLLDPGARVDFRPYAERAGLYERIPIWATFRSAAYETWVPAIAGDGPREERWRQLAARLAKPPK
jgi:hypothetical protein